MNDKDRRILKLYQKGLSVEQIARKIGYGNPPSQSGIERVQVTLKRAKGK